MALQMSRADLNTATLSRIPSSALVEQTDFYRLDAGRFASIEHRSELGQFLTPASVSRFMAHLAEPGNGDIHLLDPGAGVGSLRAAWVEEILRRNEKPRSIRLTACEIDPKLGQYLRQTIAACETACRQNGVRFEADIIEGDFLSTAVQWLSPRTLFSSQRRTFDCAILNPCRWCPILNKRALARLKSQIAACTRFSVFSTTSYFVFHSGANPPLQNHSLTAAARYIAALHEFFESCVQLAASSCR